MEEFLKIIKGTKQLVSNALNFVQCCLDFYFLEIRHEYILIEFSAKMAIVNDEIDAINFPEEYYRIGED